MRQVKNPQSNDFVSGGPTSPDIRCYQNGKKAETGKVAAGGTLGIGASQGVFHPGPIQFYMAKAPDGVNIADWDGAGNVWFKTYSEKPPASKLGETQSWSSGSKFTRRGWCVVLGVFADGMPVRRQGRLYVYRPQEHAIGRLSRAH